MAGIIQAGGTWHTHSFDGTRAHGSLDAGDFAGIPGHGDGRVGSQSFRTEILQYLLRQWFFDLCVPGHSFGNSVLRVDPDRMRTILPFQVATRDSQLKAVHPVLRPHGSAPIPFLCSRLAEYATCLP